MKLIHPASMPVELGHHSTLGKYGAVDTDILVEENGLHLNIEQRDMERSMILLTVLFQGLAQYFLRSSSLVISDS